MSSNKLNYEEYSLLSKKKQNAEYLTPKPIIDLIHNDIGDSWASKDVIDVCCGSGGLSFGLKCRSVYGVEMNPEACEVAKRNGLTVLEGDFFDFDWNEQAFYNCVISNPPYSLPRELKHVPVYAKWNQKSGVLDPFFVLESWTNANFEGYYVLFPGLLYRAKEKWFRKYLLDNNYIDKIWMIAPNTFKDTSISVFVMKLKYDRESKIVKTIGADGFESEVNIQKWIDNDYVISIDESPKQDDEIDIEVVEAEIELKFQKYCEAHRRMNEAVKEVKKLIEGEITKNE